MSTMMGSVRKVLRLAVDAPMLVKAGTVSGVLAGLSLGLMVSIPVGLVFGISLGASVGMLAGIVMDRDEKRVGLRTRQLDDIIGVTNGTLGSIPPPSAEDENKEHELRAWATEWMTPPPPSTLAG